MTKARVNVIMDGSRVLLLYRNSDGYPSCAGRLLLATLLPVTPLTSPEAALALAGALQSAYFEPAPAFLTDDYPTDYTYDVNLSEAGMRVTCRRSRNEPALMYEEAYQTIDGEVWRRTVAYNAELMQ